MSASDRPADATTFSRSVRCGRCGEPAPSLHFEDDSAGGFLCRPCMNAIAAETALSAADLKPVRLAGRRMAEWLETKSQQRRQLAPRLDDGLEVQLEFPRFAAG